MKFFNKIDNALFFMVNIICLFATILAMYYNTRYDESYFEMFVSSMVIAILFTVYRIDKKLAMILNDNNEEIKQKEINEVIE